MSGRCWPAKTPHHLIPWLSEGISMEEWRRRQTYEDIVDPVRARDLERARAEQEKKLAAKRGKKR